ncbi:MULTISPECIES: TolC family protein [Acidithiobacillus]|uniref:TolC family protein n=2 Tax=Acidithiobacillus ferruginosus TaxID=3063951 RepID=A0ACD5IL84_9PROT|nr:TolC family protein [Acidithiobacillus ferruginosus]MBU2814263.1 TolC family protein [Acidithiobacillus ferruginosus]MBU2824943.1 TolC family protein [Acidithiobacillus ferrooxidans]
MLRASGGSEKTATRKAIQGPQRPILALFLLSLLSACATYHPQPLSPERSADAFQARSLDDPKLRVFLSDYGHSPTHWPKRHWGLHDLVLLALYESPELAVQRARWQVVRANVITAGQRPNPSIGFLSQHHSIAPEGVLPWTLGFSFDIPIETDGKRGDRVQGALALADAARFQVGETAWQVRVLVRQRFLDLWAAIEQAKLLKTEVALRKRMLKLVEQRFAVGESSAFAVNSIQLELQRAQMTLAAAEAHAASARAALAQALGLPLGAIADVHFDFTDMNQSPAGRHPPLATLERAALRHRLDLQAALARYAAAEDTLKLEIAKQYPDIHLGPGYEWEEGDNKWALGLTITLPILNQNQGPIAAAKGQVAAAAATFTALQARVIGQVSQSAAGYRGALQTLRTARVLLEVQRKNQQLLERRYASGETDSLALLGGHLAYLVAERDLLVASYQAQQALGALENAVQQPLAPVLYGKEALSDRAREHS